MTFSRTNSILLIRLVITMLAEEIKKHLVDKIKNELNPDFILLFGSFAKKTSHADSDIDLAYFSDKQLSSYERFIISSELSELANREVDLVDIKQIDKIGRASCRERV